MWKKKKQKPSPTLNNLLIVQDLWQSLLSNLVNDLAERIHKIKCKNEHNNKKDKTCGIKYKDCECSIE